MVAIKKSDTDGKLFKVRQVGGLISNDYVESGFPYFLQDQASDQMTADHNQLIQDCLACVYHILSTWIEVVIQDWIASTCPIL